MKFIGETTVPDGLYTFANGVRKIGGKVFLVLPEGGGDGNCTNCGGTRRLMLQEVTGGPFETPAIVRKTSSIYHDGAWYTVDTKVYTCPMCNGVNGANGHREITL